MNRTIIAALVAAVALAAAPRARAQAKDEGPRRGMWAEKLGLPQDEAAKLKDEFKAERDASKQARRELRDAMLKLHDQVEDKASDKELAASLERVEKAREALRARREKLHAKVAAMLTPTQRAKMTLAMARRKMMGRGAWGRRGMKGDRARAGKGGDEDGGERP